MVTHTVTTETVKYCSPGVFSYTTFFTVQAQVDLEKEKVKSLHETFTTERAAMKVMIENLTLQVQNLKAAALASSDAVVKDTVSAMPNNGLSNNSSNDPPATCGNGSLEPTAGTNGDSPLELSMITATVAQLIKAQTEALAAQTQAVAAQHLPPVKTFTGDGKLTDADSFERWLENFEERAKLVGWNEAQQLHQLKLLLDKTALRAFRMFPKEDRQDFNRAKEALKNRFKSVEIEELRGLEFHHKMQTTESIEEFGLELQSLANEAFPSTPAKDFDRMLKGRFFQALHVQWQRKLEAPKPAESFKELYDRARIVEQHEKQYTAAAAARGETKHLEHSRRYRPPSDGTGAFPDKENHSSNAYNQERICFICKQPGHISHYCPHRGKYGKEASGRGQYTPQPSYSGQNHHGSSFQNRSQGNVTSRSAAIQFTSLEDFTESQLEDLLAERRLQNGKERVTESSGRMSAISASDNVRSKAVGPTVCLPITIEGVTVEALVDTGSQSTIISRAMLKEIGRHQKCQGKPLPVLERPVVRLFGKDGAGGGRELVITAQLQANITADGETTCVTVFVQPDSDQKCLLGMNVLPDLGLSITRANGEPVIVKEDPNPVVAHVSSVQTCSIPSLKGQFLKVQTGCTLPEACKSEPKGDVLESYGLCSHEAMVSVCEDGSMYVPIQNYDGVSVQVEEGVNIGIIRSVESFGPSKEVCFSDSDTCEVGIGEEKLEGMREEEQVGDEVLTGVCARVQSDVTDRMEKLMESLELPTETILSKPISPYTVEVEDYRCDLTTRISQAWAIAKEKIGKAQKAQKVQYDKSAKVPTLSVGDRVMIFMPAEMQGKTRKLARPFHGPYRILTLTPNNAEVVLVEKPNTAWTGSKKKRTRKRAARQMTATTQPITKTPIATRGPITRSKV